MGLQLKIGGILHPRLNNDERPIANKYREGKMKRTLKRESKVREIVKREAYYIECGQRMRDEDGYDVDLALLPCSLYLAS